MTFRTFRGNLSAPPAFGGNGLAPIRKVTEVSSVTPEPPISSLKVKLKVADYCSVVSCSVERVLWISSDAPTPDTFRDPDTRREFEPVFAENLASALEILRHDPVQAILIHLPIWNCSPEELLTGLRLAGPQIPVVVYEPDGLVTRSAGITDLGAFQYISQPVPLEELREVLLAALRHRPSPASTVTKRPAGWSNLLVGSSESMREVIEVIGLVGHRRSTVLITGETGTGKEVAARAIHQASNRSASRMVAINCAALPDHLLEAELFGHTKGAFTGAVNARVGLFEQAHRGTIFLDEIGEMPLQLQTKILRVLQEREVQRIGSSEPVPVDVRVIAASNQNLVRAVAQRRFREDLYYRLNVVALKMPPLRERLSDIPELAQHFLEKVAEQESTAPKRIDSSALDVLMRYGWPGNVRQLEHALESAVALSGARATLYPKDFDLPMDMLAAELDPLALLDVPESGINFEELIMGIERRLLERALQKSGGNKARAASMLNMKRTTLISKFKSLEACV
jgi:DNA-binding NtrC family response regulator